MHDGQFISHKEKTRATAGLSYGMGILSFCKLGCRLCKRSCKQIGKRFGIRRNRQSSRFFEAFVR